MMVVLVAGPRVVPVVVNIGLGVANLDRLISEGRAASP